MVSVQSGMKVVLSVLKTNEVIPHKGVCVTGRGRYLSVLRGKCKSWLEDAYVGVG